MLMRGYFEIEIVEPIKAETEQTVAAKRPRPSLHLVISNDATAVRP
jgi:hypothetical protein